MEDLTQEEFVGLQEERSPEEVEGEPQEQVQDPDLPEIPRTEFITGEAGTGKTYLVRERAKRYKGHVLCATTGIAAVNLGEGVTTINSLLGYFDTASLRDMWTQGWLETKMMKLATSGLRQITMDEVSMLDGEQLTIITQTLEATNERLEAAGLPTVGLTLTGDFLQLPPVKAKFAFQVESWEKYEQNMQRLTEVRRQADLPFIQALGATRRGRGSEALEFFKEASGFHQQTNYDYEGVTLLSKNDEVDKFNFLRMGKLPGDKVGFTSTRWGKERSEWKNIPAQLDLKIGALVMILSNLVEDADRKQLLYANGDLGHLMEVEAETSRAWVKLQRNGRVVPVSYVSRDNKIPLEPGRRKALRSEGKENLAQEKFEIIGNVTYMPLRVAYSCTVHKSQGLSLDNVQIDFRSSFFSTGGMSYVALSRARTAQGLRLVGNEATFVGRCKVNKEVVRWL